jgi:hypothetical protein
MDLLKFFLIGMAIIAGICGFFAYVKYLCDEGYDEDEIWMHLTHDVPLRILKRHRERHTDYTSYRKSPREYEKVEYDSYPSYYGCNYDPEIAALMNAPPKDLEEDKKILAAGGWKCSCGRVHAAYVSSCSCGKNKYNPPAPEPEPDCPETVSDFPEAVQDNEVANAMAIREYKKLMDDGIITPEEFEAKKKQLLGL